MKVFVFGKSKFTLPFENPLAKGEGIYYTYFKDIHRNESFDSVHSTVL
jgi:hypothetical protein